MVLIKTQSKEYWSEPDSKKPIGSGFRFVHRIISWFVFTTGILFTTKFNKLDEINRNLILKKETLEQKKKSLSKLICENDKAIITAEKNKMLNMYSLSHYESLTRNIAVNYN